MAIGHIYTNNGMLYTWRRKRKKTLSILVSLLLDIKNFLTCAKWSYHLALSTNSTNYINKANMIIVYVLSVLHSIHMHKEWESYLYTLH